MNRSCAIRWLPNSSAHGRSFRSSPNARTAPARWKPSPNTRRTSPSSTTACLASLASLLDKLGALPNAAGAVEPLTWLTASAGRETRLILVDDVAYFRADHKYTTVVTADGEALLRTPLRELLPRLDNAHFKQIHRSTIVNLKAIAGIVRDDSGRGTVRLRQRPETLTVSQPFMALFKHM